MLLDQYDGTEVRLRDLRFESDVTITTGHLIRVPAYVLYRIYEYGSQFAIVQWAKCNGAYWNDLDVRVRLIAHGVRYAPGDDIRHITLGYRGYIPAPNLLAIAAAWTALVSYPTSEQGVV